MPTVQGKKQKRRSSDWIWWLLKSIFNTEPRSLDAEEATTYTQVWKLKELKQTKLDWRVYKSVYSPTGRELNSVSRISKGCKSRWELGRASVGLAGLVISCSFSFCICA